VKRKLLASTLLLALSFNLPVCAKNVTLQELQQDVLPANVNMNDSNKSFTKDHWAYKTLENVTKKYGLLVGKPEEKFDGNKPLSRNEAAILLVSLVGKIEQDNYELTEAEKVQVDILRQELTSEINGLTGRMETLENSVESLKGTVSNLEEADKNAWQHSFGEKFKINGALQGKYTGNFERGSDNYASNFGIPYTELDFTGKLHKHISYRALLLPSRAFNNSANGIIGDAYVSTDIIPHHNILLGQTRRPIGYEGMFGPTSINLETIDKSQVSRKLSDIRDIGIRTNGNWKFIDYYLSANNGQGQNVSDNNNNLDLGGWAVIKPLHKAPQFGSLELGGGYYNGKSTYSHETFGFYSGYKFKRYAIRGEYTQKDGYLTANTKAGGWYLHNSYYLTDKMQLIARYDQFDPNTKIGKNDVSEYTGGINYYFKGNNLKLQFNYVYVDDKVGKDSSRLVTQTQLCF